MSFNKRTSLTSDDDDDGMVATVRDITRTPNAQERRVKVRTEGSRTDESLLIPKKYAKDLKPGHTYEFHLEDDVFRGGGQRNVGVNMARRSTVQPIEVSDSNKGGGTGGGFGAR